MNFVILPPMPETTQWSPHPFDLRVIDRLTRKEWQIVYSRMQERLAQLDAEDTKVYGVKRCDEAGIQYLTTGAQQKLAPSIQHTNLWLTESRATADMMGQKLGKNNFGWQDHLPPDISWAVYAIPMIEAVKLPCYLCHKQFAENK